MKNTAAIDLDVLNQLPDDLRLDIIKEYNLNLGENKIPKTESKKSPFTGMQWHQLKPVLYDWLRCGKSPADVDIAMLGDFLKQLAINRQIEMLGIVFNFLRRNVDKLDCQWHNAYFKLANCMQEGMVARYGSTLFISRDFDCCNWYD